MKPIIFISSTFYDLKYIREDLANFILSFGYEPVLFENGDIGYTPGKNLDLSCYEAMRNSDMVILIIGGKYGSSASGEKKDEFKEYMSVTRNEFKTAIDSGIPVFAMIDKNVMVEYRMYEANYDLIEKEKKGLNFVSTKNINVLRFIKEVKEMIIIPIQEFEKSSDIKGFISKQWADMLKNYLNSLRKERENREVESSLNEMRNSIENMKIMLESVLKNIPLGENGAFSDNEQLKNSQDDQSNEPSETFVFLNQNIIQVLLSSICTNSKEYCVKDKVENVEISIAIWKKFDEYRKKVLLNNFTNRIDRHKLASCICGAIIEIKPLEGLNGAKINKCANEILALHIGLNVIKTYMIYDLIHDMNIPKEDQTIAIKYIKENFDMKFPSLECNISTKRDYCSDLINTLFHTHHLCNVKGKECFHYDILAYSKIFYYLEVYNKENIKRVYQEYLNNK